jgi:hypothetical protein
MNLTWSEWLSVVGALIALLSLTVNFSKFFIDLIDRGDKRKKEEINALKAKLSVTSANNDTIVFENKGSSDAHIKNIKIDNKNWNEVFLEKMPTLISSEHQRLLSLGYVSQQIMEIEYADDYSRKYLNTTLKKSFEL